MQTKHQLSSTKHQLIYNYSLDLFNSEQHNYITPTTVLTMGQGSTEAGEASCPSVSNALCHKGPPLGRGLLLWLASPTSAHQRTTASREEKVTPSTSTLELPISIVFCTLVKKR